LSESGLEAGTACQRQVITLMRQSKLFRWNTVCVLYQPRKELRPVYRSDCLMQNAASVCRAQESNGDGFYDYDFILLIINLLNCWLSSHA